MSDVSTSIIKRMNSIERRMERYSSVQIPRSIDVVSPIKLAEVILFPISGAAPTFYEATSAGFDSATAASVDDDVICIFGSCVIPGDHTIPDGVAVTSPTGGAYFSGKLTLGNDSGLVGVAVQVITTGNFTAVTGPSTGNYAFMRDCYIYAQSTDSGTVLDASGLIYMSTTTLRALSGATQVAPVDSNCLLMGCQYSVMGGTPSFGDRVDWLRLNKILLYRADGTSVMIYEPTSAGLTAALAAAASGDIIQLPACSITGGPWTNQSGRTLRGMGRSSILTGDLTNNGTLDNLRVNGVFSNTYGYARNIYVVGRVVNNGSSQLEYSEISATSGRGVDMDSGWCRHVNVTLDGASYGFYMSGGHLFYCRVNVNTSGSTGVFCDASNSVISFCRFAGWPYGGIIRNCTIVGNSQFESVSGDGLLHDAGSAYIIASNFFTNGGGYGLNASASGLTLNDCSWTNISGEANITYGEGDRVGGNGTQDVLPRWKTGGNNVQDSHIKDGMTGSYLATLAAALTGNHTYTLQDADMTLAALNLAQTWTADQTLQADISAYRVEGIFDEPLSGNTEGEHFDNYTATYPPTWTQVDSPALVNTNRRRSYWQIGGNSTNTTWNYIKQLSTEWGTASDIYHSWTYGQIELRDGRYTADLEYTFGVYADNSGAINTAVYNRARIKWDNIRGLWQARGEYSDGVASGVGNWYVLSWPIEKLQIRLMNNGYSTRRSMRAYIGARTNLRSQTLLTSKVWTTFPTFGIPWASMSLSRGAGVDDYLFVGYVDYSTGDA